MGGRMGTSYKTNKQVESMKMKISKDENIIIIDFDKFVAVENMECDKCAFWRESCATNECLMSPCNPNERKDKKSVAFKKLTK